MILFLLHLRSLLTTGLTTGLTSSRRRVRTTRSTSGDPRTTRPARDVGQATTEYALVMLGAAVIALLVITWATAGGGAGKIGGLFDRVIDAVIGKI
jgi:hypothetical protein